MINAHRSFVQQEPSVKPQPTLRTTSFHVHERQRRSAIRNANGVPRLRPPTAFHNEAQGREPCERTLVYDPHKRLYPKGVTSFESISTPFSTRPIFDQNQFASRHRWISSRTVEERCNPFGVKPIVLRRNPRCARKARDPGLRYGTPLAVEDGDGRERETRI